MALVYVSWFNDLKYKFSNPHKFLYIKAMLANDNEILFYSSLISTDIKDKIFKFLYLIYLIKNKD